VAEPAVSADSEDLNAHLFQLGVSGGNCRQFGGSNEGEVTGVETEDNSRKVSRV
jgi:hypothetical protein